ncbi:MAG TPA: fibronectin type III domain-containing protein, partial [Polyangia bacterium]|nr:fibronectin type III domain-containing protein [Polyangia bacterium]
MQVGQATGTTTIASGESSALALVFGTSSVPDDLAVDAGAPPDMSLAATDLAGADLAAADLAIPPDFAVAATDMTVAVGATVPGAPTNVLASALVLSAKVSWTAPASNGGAAIVAYTVTSNPDDVQAVAYPPSTGATVNGLRQGGSYTFTVTATNGVGTGPASLPSAPAVMPSNLALTATTSASSTFNNPSIGVYDVALVNDGNIDTAVGPTDSWSNGQGTALPQTVTLGFAGTKTPAVVHLYTSVGYEMQAFDVQVGNGTTWTTVGSVTGNTAAYVNVPLSPAVAGTQLRVVCNTGSIVQPTIVRINELEVY